MSEPLAIDGFRSASIEVDGVRLHYRLGGDPSGKPVLLWHGFLATSYVWHAVAPVLAAAGLAVLIPDMRGFGDSDKPGGVEGYDGIALAEEFRALVERIGFGNGQPLTLVAHDMGAPPALLWAAHHRDEVAGLLYIDEPPMLGDVMQGILSYTPQSMQKGSLWWWITALAPEMPERFFVGREREFLTWFYRLTTVPGVISEATVNEYLRTFSGIEGVLGAMGVYRAAFTTIAQTEPLEHDKIRVPVVAIGGADSMGLGVAGWLGRVAETVEGRSIEGSGHFVPEERPLELAAAIIDAVGRH
ncbi:MAG: alpha/beta hydrolase [Microbacteriaceae bacterium]